MTVSSLHSLVDAAVAGAPGHSHGVAPTHAEFVDWARANGHDERVTDFLSERGDYAGTSPAAWTRYSHVLRNADYRALRCDQQKGVAIALLGEEAFAAHRDWLRTRRN